MRKQLSIGPAMVIAVAILVLNALGMEWVHSRVIGDRERRVEELNHLCAEWEDRARSASFGQAERARLTLPDGPDRRKDPAYWVAEAMVQRWFSEVESNERVTRPDGC